MLKRFGLLLALVLTVSLSVGCAKNVTPEPAQPQVDAAAEAAAAAERAVKVVADGVVYFDFDKYDIKEEFRAILNEKAEILKAYPQMRVRIEGNCDARGTQEYNLALGERRALAAYEYLVMLGVNPSQLEVISYGKENPAVAGNTFEAWAKNRRDNFRVVAR